MTSPSSQADAAAPSTSISLLAPLTQPAQPIQMPFSLRVWTWLWVPLVLLLPFLYVVFVLACSVGVCGFFVAFSAELGGGGGILWALAAWTFGLFISLCALFLWKPFLAKWAKPHHYLEVSPETEPLLFEFVQSLAQWVGAPVPERIEVCSEIFTSLSSGRAAPAWWSDERTLTLGLPLVAGFSLQQFVGILVHEFGYAAHGMHRRLTRAVRNINIWFILTVSEPDRLDLAMASWSEEGEAWKQLLVRAFSFFASLGRRCLLLLMHVSHFCSGQVMRRVEFVVNHYEAELVGSDAFVATMWQIQRLITASQATIGALEQSWEQRLLGDDLCTMYIHAVDQIPDEVEAQIFAELASQKTDWLDVYPAVIERIERIDAQTIPASLNFDGPATALFSNFPALCRDVTLAFYHDAIAHDVESKHLMDASAWCARQEELQKADEAISRFFQGALTRVRAPLALPEDLADVQGLDPIEPVLFRLRALRESIVHEAPETRIAVELFNQLDDQILELSRAFVLTHAGIWNFDEIDDQGDGNDLMLNETKRLHEQITAQQAEQEERIAAFDALLSERLSLSLGLLQQEDVAGALGLDRESQCARIDQLFQVLDRLRQAFPTLLELREQQVRLIALFPSVEQTAENYTIFQSFQTSLRQLHDLMYQVRARFAAIPYPFPHAEENISLANAMLPDVPQADDLGAMASIGHESLSRSAMLFGHVLGELVMFAEQVEAYFEMPPLPLPPPIEIEWSDEEESF